MPALKTLIEGILVAPGVEAPMNLLQPWFRSGLHFMSFHLFTFGYPVPL